MDKASRSEPHADEVGCELRQSDAVAGLQYVQILQYIWYGHQT